MDAVIKKEKGWDTTLPILRVVGKEYITQIIPAERDGYQVVFEWILDEDEKLPLEECASSVIAWAVVETAYDIGQNAEFFTAVRPLYLSCDSLELEIATEQDDWVLGVIKTGDEKELTKLIERAKSKRAKRAIKQGARNGTDKNQ